MRELCPVYPTWQEGIGGEGTLPDDTLRGDISIERLNIGGVSMERHKKGL
jgi:hypothetical protein